MRELTVLLPCRNEEETIGECIKLVKQVVAENGLDAEVLVVDNASTDGSAGIAFSLGARVEVEETPGYGSALMKGLRKAKGEKVFFADSDLTYDFKEIPDFINLLEKGNDLVIGSRFKGRIQGNAMPSLHRYLGSPLINLLLKAFFGLRVSDSQCGMRAITKNAFLKLGLSAKGMEFATEMLIEAKRKNLRNAEKPIDYFPRRSERKMRSVRDGLRHLALILKKTVS